MKLIVTIHEPTPAAALEAIRAFGGEHDGIEVRLDAFGTRAFDLRSFRFATDKPIILTDRTDGSRRQNLDLAAAIGAGIDFIDVEFRDDLDSEWIRRFADRIVLSHHDYEAVPPLDRLIRNMTALACAHTKIAVTPRTFAENREILELTRAGLTMIGMGERGLYSRILAPFFGSELVFVSPNEKRSAAPGQLSLDRALAIYGDGRLPPNPRLFAVVGNPAGHSLSPSIHNARFRERGVAAAYAIASVESFEEVAGPMLHREPFAPLGISITAPFKEEAFAFAQRVGGDIRENAVACGAVNTLVRMRDRFLADNTDVDGFAAILNQICGRDRKSAALLGAGGTARAAMVALEREQMYVTIYNRTREKGEALAREFGARAVPLNELPRFDGEIVLDTTIADLEIPIRPAMTYVRAAYGSESATLERARAMGAQLFDGLDLLRAQAERQNDLFVEACNDAV